MRLLRNLVQVKVKESSDTFDGGLIYKPDTLKTPPTEGVVVNTGPDCREVKIGQTVIFGKHAAQDLGKDDILILEEDILAILGGEPCK